MSGRVGVEQTPDIEAIAAIIWAHTGETCSIDCGEGFGYHDCDSSEERRRGCLHVAQALAPVLAAAVREAEQRALREAADALNFEGVGFCGSPEDAAAVVALTKAVHWLRDRADRVAVDAPDTEAADSGKEA